jgi:hypothetical protein
MNINITKTKTVTAIIDDVPGAVVLLLEVVVAPFVVVADGVHTHS